MKYVLTFVLAFALLCGIAQAQTVERNQAVFGGAKYVNDAAGKKTFSLFGGYAFKVGPLWSYNYIDVGADKYGAVNTEIGFPITVVKTESNFSINAVLLAGPNADWVGTSDSLDFSSNYIAYLVGAAGGLINLEWANGTGISFGGKYKFRLEDEILYEDGTTFALNLFKRF